MKHFFSFFFAFAFCTLLAAQEEDWTVSNGELGGFTMGSQFYTFVSDANLREKPGLQAKVITQLPIATPVTILEVSTDTLTQRGVRFPWLKVGCKSKGANVTGYIWGGFLAMAAIQTPTDEYTPNSGVLYLTGITAYNEAKHEIAAQVRAAKDNKELSKVEFTTTGDPSYCPEFRVMFEPFNKVKSVLSVNYYFPACGYASGNNLIFWQDNNQMTKVLETSSVSDGGVFYDSQDWILPSMQGGIGDHILVVSDQSSFEEKGDALVRTQQKYSVVLYKWNGLKLVKVKSM
jgi:hypothetical protein